MSAPRSDRAPLPWALVGYGSGGRVFHAPLLASTPDFDLVAVVTRDAERRAQVAKQFPSAQCVDDLAAAGELGAVGATISTPPSTHRALALEAISLGLHTVIDKPFALDLAQTREIVATGHRANVLTVPYFNRRWDGDFLTVRAVLESGRVGELRLFESRLDRSRPVKPGWPSDPAAGGGLLLDLGPHLVDQAILLAGAVRSVGARLSTVRDGARTEDEYTVILTHQSGTRSVLSASLAAPATGPRFLLQGTAGGLRIEGFDGQEAQLKAGGSPASLGDRWGRGDDRHAAVALLDGEVEPVVLGRGRWDSFYPAVAAAIRGEAPPPTGPADALTVAAVLDTARAASQVGRELPVETAG